MIDELLEQALNLFDGENQDVNKAVELFTLLAENGCSTAQFFLGEIYWNKLYGYDNDELALYWYSCAAENGNPLVQLWLGNNYYIGIRSPIDLTMAQYWYEKAALNNIPLAQYHLATIYAMYPQKLADYNYWMNKAAENHFLEAQLTLCENLRRQDSKEEYIKYVQNLFDEYSAKLKCDPNVSLRFACELIEGHALEHDYSLAYKLLTSDCLKNNSKSKFYLGLCFEFGWGVEKNLVTAIKMYSDIDSINVRAHNRLVKLENLCDTKSD